MPDPTGRVSHLPDFHRGVSWKQPVRVATTTNGTISTAFANGQTVDGITLATGDRILLKDQTSGAANGIYTVNSAGAPTRAFDMDQDSSTSVPAEEVMGAIVYVIAGTANGGTAWKCTNTTAPTLGSTSLTFAAFGSGAGASFATPAIVLGTAAAAGVAATVIRSDSTIVAFDATTPVTQALADSAATGSVAFAARRDHKHGMPALSTATPIVASGAGATGTGIPSSREDHVHPAGAGSGTVTTIKDEGSTLSSAVTDINFVGAGVTATGTTSVTVTIPGSSGGVSGKTPIQSATTNDSSNTNSYALTVTAPTNGNLMILVSARDDNGTISSITQTNVTWTQVATSTAAPRVEIWKGVVAASPGTGITVAYSSSTFTQCVVSEWSGITGTLDTSAVNSGSTTLGSGARTPVLLPTQSNALVIGGAATTSNSNAYDGGGVYGNLLTFDCEASKTMRMFAAYAFPGTVPCQAASRVGGSGTQSGVIVSLT